MLRSFCILLPTVRSWRCDSRAVQKYCNAQVVWQRGSHNVTPRCYDTRLCSHNVTPRCYDTRLCSHNVAPRCYDTRLCSHNVAPRCYDTRLCSHNVAPSVVTQGSADIRASIFMPNVENYLHVTETPIFTVRFIIVWKPHMLQGRLELHWPAKKKSKNKFYIFS